MATTKEDIRRWIERGRETGATHLIVVADTWDWEDYGVYVYAPNDARHEQTYQNSREYTKVMEVYWIEPEADIEAQLNMYRSFTFGP